LSVYDKALSDLLDRVFDEFGLVVCGWSGEWDVALRLAIERISTHRFGTYWTSRGRPGAVADKPITLRRASTIVILDADSFFTELADKIQAIEQFALTDPVSARVAVARLKRYLAVADQEINLHDMLVSETERVYKAARGDRYPVGGVRTQWDLMDSLSAHVLMYESDVSVLLPLMICGGYWAGQAQIPFFLKCLKRLADQGDNPSGSTELIAMRSYPALLLFYGAGIASLAAGNYSLLGDMFRLKLRANWNDQEVPITGALNAVKVMQTDLQRKLPGYESRLTPLNDHLFDTLRDPLREYVPDDVLYDELFDWFEYLLALVHCDLTTTTEALSELKRADTWKIWAPRGRFAWKGWHSDSVQVLRKAELRQGQLYPIHVGSLLKAGFFGSDGRYVDLKNGFDATVAKMAERW